MKNRLLILLLYMFIFPLASCNKGSDAPEAEVAAPVEPKDVPAAAREYAVDTLRSTINWKGSKPTGTHTGTITISNGKVFVKNDSIETGIFNLNMKSITVTDPKEGADKVNLENHLKGLADANADHFFNIRKYPKGKFEITGIRTEGGKQMVEGNLTLKDITKNIKFPATVAVTDTTIVLSSETFKINRTLWNISYSSKSAVANLGDQYISDDVEIKVYVTAVRKDKSRRK